MATPLATYDKIAGVADRFVAFAIAQDKVSDRDKRFEGGANKQSAEERWAGSVVVFNTGALGVVSNENHVREKDGRLEVKIFSEFALLGRAEWRSMDWFDNNVESVYLQALDLAG